MSGSKAVTIYTDGASRGNPGPAAYAFVIRCDGDGVIEEKGCLPDTTNNVAEYTALVRALERAHQIGARAVDIRSDSELMVRQIQGTYKVRNEGLRPLYEQAMKLLDGFDDVSIRHVGREENKRADELCNQALNEAAKKTAPAARAAPAKPKTVAQRPDVREQAVDCLRSVAAAWARGDANNPRPEDVWDQLWTILEEGGVLR